MDRLATHAQTPDDGTYLIRLSSTDPKVSPFTLSMSNNQHRRIRRLNGMFSSRVRSAVLEKQPTHHYYSRRRWRKGI